MGQGSCAFSTMLQEKPRTPSFHNDVLNGGKRKMGREFMSEEVRKMKGKKVSSVTPSKERES